MFKAYVFYDDFEVYTIYNDETAVLPENIAEEGCHLAIFVPNLPNTSDLGISIAHALE